MFGFHAIAIAPFCGFPSDVSTSFAEQVIFAATEAFTTGHDDGDLPDTFFDGRISRALVFERSILGPTGIGGAASVGFGDIELNNNDGLYDDIVSNHAIDGRRLTVRLGDPEGGFTFGDFGVIFDGTASSWALTSSSVIVSLRDWAVDLDKPIARNYYGGGGGMDGTADLTGKPVPQAFGQCLNVQGALVDPLSGIVQFNDGPMEAIDAVYDSGVELPDTGAYYTRDLATGTITMLVAIAGQITADVRGAKVGGAYVETTGDIIDAILRGSLGWGDDDLDLAAFASVNSGQPAVVGYFVNEDRTVKSVIDELLSGIGGYRSFTRTGLLEIGIFTAPGDVTQAEYSDIEILDGLDRIKGPDVLAVPTWRQRVGYQRNWTVQTSGVAGGVTADRLAFLAEEFRYSSAHDNLVKGSFLLARDGAPVAGFFADKSDADAEALRLLALFKVPRALYQCRVKTQPFTLDIAAGVVLAYPRWNLHFGQSTRIVTIVDDGPNNETKLTVFA